MASALAEMFDADVITRARLQHIIIVLLAVWAWRKGDKPEILASFILVTHLVLDYFYHALIEGYGEYMSADIGHFAFDFLTFLAIAPIAHYANRIYPLWIAAAQLIAISMHIAREVNATIDPLAYAILMTVPFYIVIGALSVGLLNHQRRIKRWGTYPAWRSSSPRS